MTITTSKTGVWILDDAYKKTLAGTFNQFCESTMWSWGSGSSGYLATGSNAHRCSPVQIPGTEWCALSGSFMALKSDCTLWTWGPNALGTLGDNTTIATCSPVQVPGSQWSSISSASRGANYKSAIKTDGTLWVWGSGAQGALGDNSVIPKSSPIQIPGSNWCQVAVIDVGRGAVKTDGTLWVWGRNDNDGHFLGEGTRINRSSPVQIPGTQWISITGGGKLHFARKSDGSLWGWGLATNVVGDGDATINKSSPVQVPGNEWNDVSSGEGNNLARKTDGTLWVWGKNSFGTIGDGTNIARSSPVQIPGNQWVSIATGQARMHALKSDGTAWGWGCNTLGGLGESTRTHRCSPIQIPGTQWFDVESSQLNTFARKLII